jgi:chaperonin cofactor prefoldin
MRQAIRFLCIVLLTSVPFAKAAAEMSPEFYSLAWEIMRDFSQESSQASRGPECKDDCFRLVYEALREMLKKDVTDTVVVKPLADGAKLGLSMLGVPNVSMSTYNAVNCYLNESTQAGFRACMMKEVLSLAVGEGLQRGANWDNVSSTLANAAWDKAYEQIAQTVNNYQARSETAFYTANRDCTVDVYLRWNKRKVPGANGGLIYVRFGLRNCRCPTSNWVREGSLSFYVPVHLVPAGNWEPGFKTGQAKEYRLRAICCNGGDNRTHVYNEHFKYMGPMKEPGEEEDPPPSTQPPRTEPPVTPPPSPPPAPPSQPEWSEENPCPECQPLLDEALRHARAARDLEPQIEELANRTATNRMRQEAARNRISRIQQELSGKEGEGGSSYDPETGITIDSWTQADGTVKVTVKDKNGNVVDEYTRPRRDVKKLQEELEREQKELEALEAEGKALEEELSKLRQQRQSELDQEQEARRKLADCVRRYCEGAVVMDEDDKKQKVCTFQDPEPVQIGPKSEFGVKSVADKAGDKAKQMVGGLVGGAIGGALGGGKLPVGGLGGPKRGSDGPKTVKDPVKNRQSFTAASGTAISFGTAPEKKGGGERVSVKVKDSPSKGVVHTISRETLGPNCEKQVEPPTEYWLYELWAEWSLKVWWTKDTYVNNQLVKHEEGGWEESGKTMLDSGIFDPKKDVPFTAWGQLGFNRPFEGPRAVGASFPEPKAGVPERYVIHVSEPENDPVTTTPFAIYPIRGANGKVEYTDKQPDWSAILQ